MLEQPMIEMWPKPYGILRMTAFDILVGIPLLLLLFGGWPALTGYTLRCHTSLSRWVCVGIAFVVGVAFTLFWFRFTASLPGTTMTPLTPEQRTIERISWLLVGGPYAVLLSLLAFRF